MQKDFDELKNNKDSFKRMTRSEAVAAEEAAKDAAINAAMGEEEKKEGEEEIIDVFDISAPQEILSKFGPDWISETLALKKWDAKRDKIIEV